MAADVCGLADAFEQFRALIRGSFGIDPVHTISAASLSWQAMLRFTGVELPLFSDQEMHMFIEEGIRGGLAVIATRHSKASHGFGCDEAIGQERYPLYVDCNGLYGHTMTMPLPMGGFAWVDDLAEVGFLHKVASVERGGGVYYDLADKVPGQGFVAEVDLAYPDHLHDVHDDYLLAPVKREIREREINAYSSEVLKATERRF